MRYFPLFFDTRNRKILIVGGEEEAAQKLRLLLKTEAEIEIIAEHLNDEILHHVNAGRIRWLATIFAPKLLDGASLVYATQDEEKNRKVAQAARVRNISVNAVDMPELCDVITPAIVDRDPVVIAIGTEGAAPVLARQIKSHLEGCLPQNLGLVAKVARGFRQRVAATLPKGKMRRSFWEKCWSGKINALFLAGKVAEGRDSMHTLLGQMKCNGDVDNIGRISLVGAGPGAADLLTFRAMQRLQSADVIICDPFVNPAILECARRDARRIIVGGDVSAVMEIKEILMREALQGNHVIYLKNAGSAHFSSLRAELRTAEIAGILVDVVPGIAPLSRQNENTVMAMPLRRVSPASTSTQHIAVPAPRV